MLKGFKKFIARGNVIDLAVGVVMGAAFSGIVKGLVDSFINPLIAWVAGKPNFDQLTFSLPPINPLLDKAPTVFEYGKVITASVNFLLIAFAIYFFVIIPVNRFLEKVKKEEDKKVAVNPTEQILLLREIRDQLAQINQQNNAVKDNQKNDQ